MSRGRSNSNQSPLALCKLTIDVMSFLKILPVILEILISGTIFCFLNRISGQRIEGYMEYSFQDGDTNTLISFLKELQKQSD